MAASNVVSRSTLGPTTGIATLLRPGLKTVYYESGKERPLEYPMIANVADMDWNPETDLQAIGLGTMPPKNEGDQFTLDGHDLGGTKEYLATPWGLAIEFTFEAWRDELYGVLEEMIAESGRITRQRQEIEFWNLLNNGFDTSFAGFTSGEALFGAHVGSDGVTRRNRPSVDIGMSTTYIQGAVLRFETMTSERNVPRLMAPVMAVGTPTNKIAMREVLGSSGKPYSADNEINALIEEDLSWMVSHYLTNQTQIVLLAAKGVHDLNFRWRDQPIFDSFDDPWTKNAIFTMYQRFICGYGSWRGADSSFG
jgi:hypothetical protein